jgi:hypothetical protein
MFSGTWAESIRPDATTSCIASASPIAVTPTHRTLPSAWSRSKAVSTSSCTNGTGRFAGAPTGAIGLCNWNRSTLSRPRRFKLASSEAMISAPIFPGTASRSRTLVPTTTSACNARSTRPRFTSDSPDP